MTGEHAETMSQFQSTSQSWKLSESHHIWLFFHMPYTTSPQSNDNIWSKIIIINWNVLHKHTIEQRKPSTKYYMLYDSIYTIFKNRQNLWYLKSKWQLTCGEGSNTLAAMIHVCLPCPLLGPAWRVLVYEFLDFPQFCL